MTAHEPLVNLGKGYTRVLCTIPLATLLSNLKLFQNKKFKRNNISEIFENARSLH